MWSLRLNFGSKKPKYGNSKSKYLKSMVRAMKIFMFKSSYLLFFGVLNYYMVYSVKKSFRRTLKSILCSFLLTKKSKYGIIL